MVSLLTCTGDRPEAFALCEKYMARQTKKWWEWIVVDDGKVPVKTTMGQQVIRRKPQPDDPTFTLIPNLRLGLSEVAGDILLFPEDDDWYHPTFIERMEAELETADLVGQKRAVYYHVGVHSISQHHNESHASLCETGIAAKWVPTLLTLLNDVDPFLDLRLWKLPLSKTLFVADPRTCVGIKGMPGRDGIGKGHLPIYAGYQPDPQMDRLRDLIGKEDADVYATYAWEGAV